ncbi:hypothetical protein M0812_08925 [Anaeramoeba flamelloides]|uniref:Uncharacterized protein n=1 Tax=Anaeramoeba flamelloides TaxID=1746091 RepID=A0AAV7ZTB2_9EUKA|nr:hypothetical protein M0812_08925 [Anaeramoeba flamelloides]
MFYAIIIHKRVRLACPRSRPDSEKPLAPKGRREVLPFAIQADVTYSKGSSFPPGPPPRAALRQKEKRGGKDPGTHTHTQRELGGGGGAPKKES